MLRVVVSGTSMAIPCCFFLFKQKTAYEMRISDRSSDVCSSDLAGRPARPHRGASAASPAAPTPARSRRSAPRRAARPRSRAAAASHPRRPRSEEHTSELQSLMRISYAVFCLKKKHNKFLIYKLHTNKLTLIITYKVTSIHMKSKHK